MYEDIGLDKNLHPIDNPFSYGGTFTPFDFDSYVDRSAISNEKLSNINADKITAGTITSGIIYSGTINGNQVTAGTLGAAVAYVGTLSASQITAGTMSANRLSAGTIDASNIKVTNLDAGEINTGAINVNTIPIKNLEGVTNSGGSTVINGGYITTGTIDATQVTVDNIDANNINAGTLTGRTVRSSSGSNRVELTSGDRLNFYNSGTVASYLLGGSGNYVAVSGALSTSGGITTDRLQSAPPANDGIYTGSLKTSSIDLNNGDMTNIDELRFRSGITTNYNNSQYEIWAYDSSEKGFRCRVEGSLYQFDLTSK